LDAGISASNPYTEFGTGIDFKGRDYSNAVRNYGGIYSIMTANSASGTPAGDAGFKSSLTFYTNTGGASGTNPTEKVRIDSSGNLNVSRSAYTSASTNGFHANADGWTHTSVSGEPTAYFNRNTSDGDVVKILKDGTTVGSIGVNSGNLYLNTLSTGLLSTAGTVRYYWDDVQFYPAVDANKSLGISNLRWKALHLSTNIHQGATTPSSSAAGVLTESIGRVTYSRGSSTGGFGHVTFINGNGTVGSIVTASSATSYNTSSDYRLKENVVSISGATERLKQLKPSRFNFIADADTTVDGFLAHEVQDIVPEAITGTKDAMMDEEYEVTPAVLDDDGNVVTEAVMGTRSVPNYQGIDQSKLVPLLVATIQELEARIAALES
jgi:hypothetical protein